MSDSIDPLLTLDALSESAVAGDRGAEASLFEDLHVRFTMLTKRRVRPDHVEDLVQDALGIVLKKYRDRPRTDGILVWSLTVLRNVIGNHYQSRRRETERTTQVEDWQTMSDAAVVDDPAVGLEEIEAVAMVETAVAELAAKHPRCGAIFTRILESLEKGGGVQEISQRAFELVRRELPDLSRNTFYVALHRCRAQLRTLLERGEQGVGHA